MQYPGDCGVGGEETGIGDFHHFVGTRRYNRLVTTINDIGEPVAIVLAMVSRHRRLCSQASSYRARLFRRDAETNTRGACATRSTAAMRERIGMLPAGCRQLQASSG